MISFTEEWTHPGTEWVEEENGPEYLGGRGVIRRYEYGRPTGDRVGFRVWAPERFRQSTEERNGEMVQYQLVRGGKANDVSARHVCSSEVSRFRYAAPRRAAPY